MEQNSAFFDKIATLRQRLPDWMEYTLLGVYIVSAGVGALFLSKLLYGEFQEWGTAFAILIAIATQIVRLIVVFFDQLNPQRPALDMKRSYLAAVGLGGVSVYEAIELVGSLHLHNAVTISIAGLMVVGIVIELYVLRELQHATNYHFFSNPQATQELIAFHQQQAAYQQLMKQLKSQIATGKFNGTIAAPTPPQQQAPQPTSTINWTPDEMLAIAAAYQLNKDQLLEIQLAKKNGEPEGEILKLIDGYSTLNLYNVQNKATAQSMRQTNAATSNGNNTQMPFALNFTGNGNGHHP